MCKTMLRFCSLILVLVMLANMLPMQSFAADYRASLTADTQITEEDMTATDAQVVEEITEKRTEFSKEFLLSNGLHMAAVYPDPVHYEVEGGWEEIDNSLKTNLDGTYANTAGVWDVRFPQQLTGAKYVTVTKDGYTLSFAMAGEVRSSGELVTASLTATEELSVNTVQTSTAKLQTVDMTALKESLQYAEMAPEKLQSRLVYENVYANTNIIYDLDSNKVKESIVLESYSSTLRGYRYTLNVGQLLPVLEEEGHIDFLDAAGKTIVMTMPAPYLVDAASAFSDDIQVQLTGSGSIYTLTYLLPQQWLASADRAWPVVLDPVITANVAATNILDRRISEGAAWSYTHHLLEAGYDASYGKTRSYLQFVNLPKLSSADVVVGASIQLFQPTTRSDPSMELCVEVRKVNTRWHSQSITWGNQPALHPVVDDYCMVGGTPGYYSWVITDIVRNWYADGNYGLVFKSTDANEASRVDNWMQFYSVDAGVYKPILAIVFRNNNGLESYWDYTSASAGRAGTGYVNNYTGNLVWVHDTIGFGGNRMPVSITHVYNANDRNNNRFALGYGWRTNFHQRVYQWTANSNYYVWEDADGTKHYFLYDSANTYLDEDGLELTLTTNGSGTQKYCITDKYGNKSYFDTYGRLTKQENNQQTPSSITVTYTTTSGYLISTITDGAGRVYRFTYDSDTDLGATWLDYISYTGKGTTALTQVTFYYESGDMLTGIVDADEGGCSFYYGETNLLTAAVDTADYKLTYEYNTTVDGKPSRVSRVCEYDGTVQGGELTMEYAHNQTTFTDHNGNVEIMQFNDFGNTVSIQDDEGKAQYTQYAFNTANDVQNNTDTTAKGNQLRLSSKLQNTVGNRLQYSSVENGLGWTAVNSYATVSHSADAAYLGSYSAKVVSTSTGTETGIYGNSLTAAANSTFTFSAYVKTGSNSAYLGISDGSTVVTSEPLAANSNWTRLQVSYTNSSTSSKTLTVRLLTKEAGTCYIDCGQMEASATASRYNLIENGDFCYSTTGWTNNGFSSAALSSAAAPELQTNAVRVSGWPTAQIRLSQTVNISGSEGDSFILSGWAKGDSAPLEGLGDEERKFGMLATFNYTDGTTSDPFEVSFNPDADSSVNWQYAAMPFVAEKDYSAITVHLAYDYNVNTAWFDGIQLYREEFGSSYTYDDEGNVTSVTDLQKKQTTYEYSGNNLTKEILPSGVTLDYTYDQWNNVKTATTQEGLVYNFTYDTYGNNTSVSITADGQTMTSTAVYTSDGNRLSTTTDALGKTTTYSYNENTNVLEWVKYPEDTDATRTNYSYDELFRLTDVYMTMNTGKSTGVNYYYNEDKLEELGFCGGDIYFVYTDFDQIDWIGTDFLTLASYTYTNDRNRYLEKLDYGNGGSVQYTYDDKGRVVKETYEDGDTVTYTYDNDGALAAMYDSATGRTTKYYYDFIGRTMKQVETGTNYSHSVSYGYDEINNLTSMVDTLNGSEFAYTYTYDDDNRIASVYTDNYEREYTYDDFGRLTNEVTGYGTTTIVTQTPTYFAPSANTTSGQVATYQVTSSGYNKTFSYTYDDNGNILSISDGTHTTSYVYDSANQLIRENNQAANKTWTWEYEDGNILCKKEYAYTTGELGTLKDIIEYGYDYSEWGQLLSSYDGRSLYYGIEENEFFTSADYDGKYELTWEHGHQLQRLHEMTYEDNYREHTFAYDANGMRIKRRIWDNYGSELTGSYEYIYSGDVLRCMTYSGVDGSYTMDFEYDANGAPVCVNFMHYAYQYDEELGEYMGAETKYECCLGTYYFVTNLQGDVIALVDWDGNLVGTYTYDAWGKPLSIINAASDTCLIYLNPLRYRGYVYDTETGFYYLQSRYYDPVKGRFISPDAFVSTGQDILGYNMFAYCGNNPVTRVDASGYFWNTIIGAAAGAIVGGISAAIMGTDIKAGIASGALSGAISGAALDITIATGGAGLVALAAVTAASGVGGAASSYVNQRMNGTAHDEVDWGTVAVDGVWGAVGGALSFGMADIGGATCKTLTQTFAQTGKEIVTQAASDFAVTATIAAGTWLNGTKTNALRNHKTSTISMY